MSAVVSVTEIRNALRCPRIFALGRLRKNAVAFPVGSSCLGAAFHKIVARFAATVAAPPVHFAALARGAALDDLESGLARWLVDLLIDELRANPTYATMPGEVDDLAQALRELARHLAARLRAFDAIPAEALTQLVRDAERSLEASVEDVVVRGTFDALYGHPNGALEVIEYKLTDEANDELDRAQVALYAHLPGADDGRGARGRRPAVHAHAPRDEARPGRDRRSHDPGDSPAPAADGRVGHGTRERAGHRATGSLRGLPDGRGLRGDLPRAHRVAGRPSGGRHASAPGRSRRDAAPHAGPPLGRLARR